MGREDYSLESLEFLSGHRIRAKVIVDDEYSTWLHTYHDFSNSGMKIEEVPIGIIRELAFADAELEMEAIERQTEKEIEAQKLAET